MKKNAFYLKLAEHIQREKTFDMKMDVEGYPTIQWLIAASMLEEYPRFEQFRLLASYVTQVKNSLKGALDYLEEQGVPTYRSVPMNEKKISFITTDPSYDEAKEKDYKRQVRRTLSNVKSFRNNMIETHADKFPAIQGETKRLENKLGTVL